MPKIVKIENDKVLIGMDDGILKELPIDCFGFSPCLGDEIEIFENNNRTIIFKKEKQDHEKQEVEIPSKGININLNNSVAMTPQPGTTVYQTTKPTKVVNKIVYCLLAFFLGGFGGHKFYAGKIGSGVCYLLFCWTLIPAILAIIDLIVGLCKHADSNGNIAI